MEEETAPEKTVLAAVCRRKRTYKERTSLTYGARGEQRQPLRGERKATDKKGCERCLDVCGACLRRAAEKCFRHRRRKLNSFAFGLYQAFSYAKYVATYIHTWKKKRKVILLVLRCSRFAHYYAGLPLEE